MPVRPSPLAVVGVSALFPGSTDAHGFWRDILAGRDLITDVPPTHWLVEDYYDPDPKAPDKTYAKRGGFLETVEFDPLEHGVPPSVVPATDTSQLLALIVARQVLEDATRGRWETIDRERVSVILGVTSAQELLVEAASRLQRPVWVKALREHGLGEDEVQSICDRIAASYTPWQESTFPGLLGNVVAGRIANRLDLGGTNCVTDAACASSFSALAMGASELWLGQSDLAIVGGVETFNDIFMYMCFSKTPALSPSGVCHPFGAGADGTLLGEGLGMLALRRLEDAERDGDRVYAVIRGIGSSSDGRAKSVYAPLPEGQARALRRAYEAAGYGPETVELVEAHGTGTRAGDAAEFEGLRQVFEGSGRGDRQWCALGTVKSQIGHTKAAAGAAGLFKAIMALHHGALPPTLGVERPNPALRVGESPFYLPTRPRPWVRGADHPRRASVSSFGFGGSNFHVAVEEYTGPAARAERCWTSPTELVLLSAEGAGALAERCDALAAEATAGRLAFLAHRSQDAFDASQPARLAAVASDEADLRAKLERAVRHLRETPDADLDAPDGLYAAIGAEPGSVAFLFPGQGSQYTGMGADLAIALPQARAAWDAAASLGLPVRLHDLAFPPEADGDAAREAQEQRLRRTENAQPAIGAASQALLGVLRAVGVEPDVCAGHSFGELTALHAVGALGAADLLRVARFRGERMAEAAADRPGAMLAVPLGIDDVRARCESWGLDIPIANVNGPRQVVLSGDAAAIETARERFQADGVPARALPVSTAFHSPLVAAAVPRFLEDLGAVPVESPVRPVFANLDASPWPAAPERIREQLAEQIARPVRFQDVVEALWNGGCRTFVEVGPGAVLSGLVSECLATRPHRAVPLDRRGRHGLTSLWHGLGHLAVAGVTLDLRALRRGVAPAADPAARPAKPHALRLNGANYAKPYPPPGGAAALPPPNPPRVAAEASAPAPVTASAPPPDGAPSAAPDPARLAAWVEVQRQTAEAHETYLRLMAEAHAAFLAATAGTPLDLGTSLTRERPAAPAPPSAIVRRAAAPPPAAAASLSVPVAPAAPLAPAAASAPSRPAADDLQRLLLEVVADKTGYPVDMLQPQMQLEADLGVDSIKRVEILAALQERAPDLPEVAPAEVAALRTLGQIAAFLGRNAPTAPAPRPHAPVPAAVTAIAAPGADLQRLLLEVVADKTGYPADMLKPEMQLEADLGIDSIKRVEILAALQERAPALPDVPPAEVAALRTLGQIAGFLGRTAPTAAAAPVAATPMASTSPTPGRSAGARAAGAAVVRTPAAEATNGTAVVGLGSLLLEVVAEKTGYPADMLKPEMQLEADLGIDSIKRVEILAALQERAPHLPDVPPAEVAALRTLGQIADFLGRTGDAGTPAAATAAGASAGPDATAAPASGTPTALTADRSALAGLEGVLLGVVADKTGYPADMLKAEMQLEADLGIDSIKRVEILAALQECIPDLPEVPPAEVAALRTLGQIVAFLDAAGRSTAPTGPAAAAPAPPPAPEAALGRWAVAAEEAPVTTPTGLLPPGQPVRVRDGSSGMGAALVARLREAGFAARLDAGAEEAGGAVESVILLDGLAPVDSSAAALDVARDVFHAARAFAAGGRGVLVTVQDTGGDFGLGGRAGTRAWLGGLPGLVKSAALELPEARFRAIDLERGGREPDAVAAALVGELTAGGDEIEVGLRADGRRLRLVEREAPAEAAGPAPGPDDVLVVSGGARGVTAAAVRALAGAHGPRLALLGRTPLSDESPELESHRDEADLRRALIERERTAGRAPTPAAVRAEAQRVLAAREVRETLAAVSAAGARALYLEVDVADRAAVAAALDRVRAELGPITGVIHGAGALSDRRLTEKSDADLARVLGPKLLGLDALLDATAADPVRWLLLFSSVAARAGNPGQSDYALANETLNQIAAAESARRGTGITVRALGWGPWDGGMVDSERAERFRQRGVGLIPIAAGAAQLLEELHDAGGPPVVVLGSAPSLAAPKGAAEVRLEVSARSHPFLDSHRVRGVPVVPVALVLEWFARAAAACRPDLALVAIRDVRVRAGVRLPRFENEGHPLRARARQIANGAAARLALELVGEDGRVHYSATADMGAVPAVPPPVDASGEEDAAPLWNGSQVYDGVRLFHGPAFQALRAVGSLDAAGATAHMVGLGELGWPEEPWQIDAAAVDGALQLALLHAREVLGSASLPTAIGALLRHRAGPARGALRAALRARSSSAWQTLTDVVLLGEDGVPWLELRGVEVTALPDSVAATPGDVVEEDRLRR